MISTSPGASVPYTKPVVAPQREFTIKDIEPLAERIINKYKMSNKSTRFIVTVSGIPGAGKSTITSKLVEVLSRKHNNTVALLPQDGFHYYRHELHQMENPQEAIARRGAPFTYNRQRFIDTVAQIKYQPLVTIHAPGFSHELKDPQENEITIDLNQQIVIVEGNYVNLDTAGWDQLGSLSDEKWMVVASLENVRTRLIARHLEAGIASSSEESAYRVDNNDLVNAKYILDHSYPADVLIYN